MFLSNFFLRMIHFILRWRKPEKCILLGLFALFLLSIFWLGRLTAQLSILERDIAMKKTPKQDSPKSHALSTYLMVLIMTKSEESDLRNTIRQTWLRLSTKTPEMYKHLFVMGTKGLTSQSADQLNAESDKFGDLLLLRNFTESYEKLSEKTLSAISISFDAFAFKFLLKVDGDSFVRLGALLKSLRDIEHPKLYWGFLDGRARPFAKGKWLEEEWRLCDYYLPYQLGGGYILSHSLAEFIANNRHLLKLYRSEDVSVGAWLAGLDVRYVHDPRFDTEWKSRGCNNEYLITHKKSPAEMRHLFDNLASRGALCFPGEYQLRPSYVYDFSVPPSQCCARRNGTKIP